MRKNPLNKIIQSFRPAVFMALSLTLLLFGCMTYAPRVSQISTSTGEIVFKETKSRSTILKKGGPKSILPVEKPPITKRIPEEKIMLVPPAYSKTFVGVLLPLTGKFAPLGRSLLDAIQLALFEVAEENVVLLPRDTKGTVEGAVSAAQSAIDAGAQFLIGPVFSSAARAVADLKKESGLISIAFTNDRIAAGQSAYIIGLIPRQRIKRIVGFAMSRGVERFAALLPSSPYGDLILEYYKEIVIQSGGVFTRVGRYLPGQQKSIVQSVKRLGNYDERKIALENRRKVLESQIDAISQRQLRRLEDLETLGDVDFEAVLLVEDGQALTALAPLLPYYEIDTRKVRILGISDWGARALHREPALQGAWYAAPSRSPLIKFYSRYREIYGRPPHPLASLAYDAGALASVLGVQKPPAFSEKVLTNPRGFSGSIGLFRFRKDGLVEHNFSVLEVRPDGPVEISRSAKSFVKVRNN